MIEAANTENIRHSRRRTVFFGESQLENWARFRELDFERIGPQANRTLERALEMHNGGTPSTATHDEKGNPLLSPVEKAAERARTTMSVELWVCELPEEHRRLIKLHLIERRRMGQIAMMMGITPNHATHMLDDAKYMIGRRACFLRGVDDPAQLGRPA